MMIDVFSNITPGRASSGLAYWEPVRSQIQVGSLFHCGRSFAQSQACSKTSRMLSVTSLTPITAPSEAYILVLEQSGPYSYNGTDNLRSFLYLIVHLSNRETTSNTRPLESIWLI